MGAQRNAAPVIIKRKKVVGGDGHHGGAWKVAYADFVTAMMAFFMLMWLLNATTEKQRKGIADYFNPNVPINRISGGGDAMFGGDSVFAKDTLAKNGSGGMPRIQSPIEQDLEDLQGNSKAPDRDFSEVKDLLIGNGGESLVAENAMKHIVTRLTDEGLIIEIFDLEGLSLFESGTDEPRRELRELVVAISVAIGIVGNRVAVEAHVRSEPVVLADKQSWALSSDRAQRVRKMLEDTGVAAERFDRVTGHADRDLAAPNPRSERNNRIEIILLRSDREP